MILDWKIVANKIYEDLKDEISIITKKPKLRVILVWENPESIRYVHQKQKWANYVWFDFELIKFENNISQDILENEIIKLNNDDNISWFIVQLPLPKNIDEKRIINLINPDKDIDWFHPINQGKILIWDNSWLVPCTPRGVIELLNYYNIDIVWQNITIIWRSNIVGKPLANLLINIWATVTVCNSKTKNISFYTKNSDIVILAMWVAKFLKKEMISKDCIVIDVWFSIINNKIYWDADAEEIEKNWNSISPVPGGVGTLTVANLLKNTLKAYKNKY